MQMTLSKVPGSQGGPLPQLEANMEDTAEIRTKPGYRPISGALAITPTVSVVIPARNEAANLPYVFSGLPSWVDEIVLVDGHSVDDTVAVTRALCPEAKVIAQTGQGKGDALLAGFAAATGDIIVTIDADGSTDGAEIIGFVGALVAGADFAKGSRFSGSGHSDDITAVRRCGNRLLNIIVNLLFKTQFTDLCYGYNAFWARDLEALEVNCAGFEIETLMNIRAAKVGLKIHEIPSQERCRIFGTSNLRAVRDGLRILRVIVRERFSGRQMRQSARSPALGSSAVVASVVPEATKTHREGA
jgi:glycosyltransferase involved in cell wall biosynthesis